MIVSDNGTRAHGTAMLAWCGQISIEWHYTTPGQAPETWLCGELPWPHAR